jgi:predicted component of type VI protein secretion system
MTEGFRLVMTKGPQPGQTFNLDQDMTNMGRGPSNEIVINHAQVSRQHARLTRQGGTMVLEDLGSTNGTYVNGVRLTAPQTLNNGDVIGLGDTVTFTFHGPTVGAEDTVVARPSAQVSRPDTVVAPPSPSPPRAESPPAYAAAPSPSYTPPPSTVEESEEKPGRTWVWIGCGCLVLLVVLACVGVFVLDYLQVLPPAFYEPLRWLGFF